MFNLTRGATMFKFHWHKAKTRTRLIVSSTGAIPYAVHVFFSMDKLPARCLVPLDTPTLQVVLLGDDRRGYRVFFCILFLYFCIFAGTS